MSSALLLNIEETEDQLASLEVTSFLNSKFIAYCSHELKEVSFETQIDIKMTLLQVIISITFSSHISDLSLKRLH